MKTMKEEVLNILNDGKWHGAEEFIHLGWSFRNRISELRDAHYHILSERQEGKKTARYRLIREVPIAHFSSTAPEQLQRTLFPMTKTYN